MTTLSTSPMPNMSVTSELPPELTKGSVSPVTGKWRIETVAVNKPVSIAAIPVHPGDLVVADECGVCFVPHARALDVLEKARQIEQSEKWRLEKLAAGIGLAEFAALRKK